MRWPIPRIATVAALLDLDFAMPVTMETMQKEAVFQPQEFQDQANQRMPENHVIRRRQVVTAKEAPVAKLPLIASG